MKVDAPPPAQPAAQSKQPFSAALKHAAPTKREGAAEAPQKPDTASSSAPKRPSAGLQNPGAATSPRPAQSTPRPPPQARLQAAAPTQRGALAATRQAQLPTRALAQARVQVDAEARRLGTVRSEHSQSAQSMTQARTERSEQLHDTQHAKLMDALTQELSKDAPPAAVSPTPRAEAALPGGAPAKVEAPPETKAAQAAALIEKLEHFVRSNRPGLSLTLNNSLGARVELERLGPKELSVKLYGKPGAEAVGRIREELRARGLNVKLTVV